MQSALDARPDRRAFLASNRGGGLYSEAVSQPIGSALALAACRAGLAPALLSLANLAVGLVAALVVISRAGRLPGSLGLLVLLAWQLAYALDCADGQLARVTGQVSRAGARLDVLCDVAVQIGLVAALSSVAMAYRPGPPAWLVATFAGTWMVNLVTSVMQSGPSAASMVVSRSAPVRIVKLVRDYGAVVLLAGLVLTFIPQWTIMLLWFFTVINGVFLLASIGFSAHAGGGRPARATHR